MFLKKEVQTEQEIQPEATSSPEQQVFFQFEIRTTSRDETSSESDYMPLAMLKTLEELKQENEGVRSCLDKQDDIFKEQAQANTKIEGLLQLILSRLSLLPKTFFVVFCLSF